MSKPRIALVVPCIEQVGGVPAVARFVKDRILDSGRYDIKVISMPMSSNDDTSVNLLQPNNWWRGVTTRCGEWQGLPFVHVGAVIGEMEFQRYRPRRSLTDAVAECDILQVVCGSPAWAYAVCGLGKPVSVQCATRVKIERLEREANQSGLVSRWRKAMTEIVDRMEVRALRTVDAIQVENPWMFDYASKLNQDREVDLRYAPPGIDAAAFCPGDARNLEHDPYVLCVGRLDDPRKNIGLLLEAFALTPDAVRSRLRLVLAGQAGPPEDFWRRADTLGLGDSIQFFHRPAGNELVSLYQKASVFALPSHEEGLGVVLLEAMGCEVPVVSTRSGGPEGVITDGENGYLVPLGDAAALAERIVRLCEDEGLNRVMGRKARATIESRYAEEVAGQAFLDVWDRLLDKAGKA